MSTTAAAVSVVVFLVVALSAMHWLKRRLERAASMRDRLMREACERAGLVPPAPDNRLGTNYADQDVCELVWSMPAYNQAAAAIEELGPPLSPDPMDAVHKDQTEGDQ